MTNCKAQSIADKMLEFFCQVGFPKTIRSDNQFDTKILTTMRERLGIQARFSAPYHPVSHGRIERANRTILEMLRKFCYERPTFWNVKLPYLLYALREVPCSSSGFRPFELAFGRKPRGLLTLMREQWAGRDRDELETMERDGVIIRDPQATWNSPLVIVKKKDGSIRICNNSTSELFQSRI